jgi:phosphatidate phosphatase APP1
MKFILLIQLFILGSLQAASISIISDFDDTIKRTNVKSPVNAALNGAFTRKIFSSMDKLIETMQFYTNKTYVLSNSPNFLRPNIFGLIDCHDMRVDYVSTRNIIRDRDGFKYKYNFIKEKITNSDDRFILLGDDVGEDPEVYKKIKEDYPSKISAIYIHKVKNRDIPKGTLPYFTASDIALYEYSKQRMQRTDVLNLLDSVVNGKLKRAFPRYTFCPKKDHFWKRFKNLDIAHEVQAMAKKINNYCR